MPELPEVETTRRGIERHLLQQSVQGVILRQRSLRWPVPEELEQQLPGCTVQTVQRRGKYLLLDCGRGHVLIHLGMSGSLRVLPAETPAQKHDHLDIVLSNGQCLRYHDPRRFGCVLWTTQPVAEHPLLATLGPEPLSDEFDGAYLYQAVNGRRVPIKTLIMDSHVVVGVGNIYANESLFLSGILPNRAANRISAKSCERLVEQIKQVLAAAIEQGGTTLRDFTNSDGKPGYFAQQLHVYGRENEACPHCAAPIKRKVISQRATYYCTHCQH